MSLVIQNSEPRIYSYDEEKDINIDDEKLDDDTRSILKKYARQGEISNYAELYKDLAKHYAQSDEEREYIDSMDFTICDHESDLPLNARIMVRFYVQNDSVYRFAINCVERVYNYMERPFMNGMDMYIGPRQTPETTRSVYRLPLQTIPSEYVRNNRFIFEDESIFDFSSLYPSMMRTYEESRNTNMRRNAMVSPSGGRDMSWAFEEFEGESQVIFNRPPEIRRRSDRHMDIGEETTQMSLTQMSFNSIPSIFELHREEYEDRQNIRSLNRLLLQGYEQAGMRRTHNGLNLFEDEFGSDHANFNSFEPFELFDEFAMYNHGLSDIEKHSTLVKIEEPKLCTICTDNFEVGKEFRIMTCKHEYCINCANKWFEKCVRCPLCNHEFETNRLDPYRYDNEYDEYSDMPDLVDDDDSDNDVHEFPNLVGNHNNDIPEIEDYLTMTNYANNDDESMPDLIDGEFMSEDEYDLSDNEMEEVD